MRVAKEPLASFEMYVDGAITRSRLQGEINDTEINHGHFREGQKNNVTGNSVENLQWVIKLESEEQPAFVQAMQTLDTSRIRDSIDARARAGLREGYALEIINDAIKQVVEQTLTTHALVGVRTKIALKRSGVLDGARVVIGESRGVLHSDASAGESGRVASQRKYSELMV